MPHYHQDDKYSFLYPRSRYYGQSTPENIAFNAKLQEFAQKISYISNFVSSGKISPAEADLQIKSLWQELKTSKKQLGISKHSIEKS